MKASPLSAILSGRNPTSLIQEWLHCANTNKASSKWQSGRFLLFGDIKSRIRLCYEYTEKMNMIYFLRQ